MKNLSHLKPEDIVLSLGFYMNHRGPSGPGQAVMECDEETREKLSELKASDLNKIRPDIAVIYANTYDYKESWAANIGRECKKRMPDEYYTAMLIKFDREMLGIRHDLRLNAAERWAMSQTKATWRANESKENQRGTIRS